MYTIKKYDIMKHFKNGLDIGTECAPSGVNEKTCIPARSRLTFLI
jgi:hypothetical protein